jgi:flagellar hook-length control protein FliK
LNPTAIEMPPEQSSTVSNAAIDGRDWLSSGDTAMADDGTPSDVSNLTVRVGSGVSADSNGAQAVGQAFNGGLDSNTAKLDPWDFVPPPRSIEPQTDTPVVQSGRPTADTIDPLTGKNIAPQAIAFETMQKQKIVAADDMRGGLNAKLQPSLNGEKTSVDGARTSRTGPTQQFAPIVPQNQKASDKISSEAVDQQSGANAVSESKKVASASPSSSGGSNRSLAQSEKGFSGGPKEMKISESQDGLGFDNVLGPAVKSGVATGVESKIADLAAKVNDQIEPRVLQMAALASVGERKVLKMRLNPAELGTVEITLEKNTAGRISAIFHTETEGSQRILNQGLTQLRASLENAGCPIGNIEITCSSSNSNSGGQSETRSQQFGQTEDSSVGKSIIDGNSTTEDDQQERLVNLRA